MLIGSSDELTLLLTCLDRSSGESEEQRLQRQAESELLHGSVDAATSSGSEPRLVIGQTSSEDSKKRAPLLSRMVRNANESEDDKFRRDLSSQADDMDFKSSAYRAVPVEQFGLAALRGMGWDGDAPQRQGPQEPMVAREQRLGLGATAAPSKALLQGRGGGAGPRAAAATGRGRSVCDISGVSNILQPTVASTGRPQRPTDCGCGAWQRRREPPPLLRLRRRPHRRRGCRTAAWRGSGPPGRRRWLCGCCRSEACRDWTRSGLPAAASSQPRLSLMVCRVYRIKDLRAVIWRGEIGFSAGPIRHDCRRGGRCRSHSGEGPQCRRCGSRRAR